MEYIFDNYKFIVEENNCNNILLEKLNDKHQYSIITAIKKFILFLHKKQIQYVVIYDVALRDRYSKILKYIYKKSNNTERWLYSLATFVNDGDNIICKIY